MKCPKCGATEDIKWFLRHQKESEDDDSEFANVITILCTECGYNESYFLIDCLEGIFPKWKDSDVSMQNFMSMLSMMNGGNMTEGESFE